MKCIQNQVGKSGTVFWLLIILGMVYLYCPVILNETFFFRDVGYDFVPQKQLFVEIVKQGKFPLWDVYRHGGQPYFADLNNSPLYPTNLLYGVLPFFKAFSINILLHLLCALGSAYLFARVIGLGVPASAATAILYGFNGYFLSLINLHGRFLAMALLPLLMLAWHLALLNLTKRRWFVLTAIVGVCQVLAGAPEVNVFSMLLLAGWAFFYPYPRQSFLRKMLVWILLVVAILGISSIQLIPTLEMSALSTRGAGIEYAVFSQWSLYPARLGELLIPGFFGYADTLPFNEYYWGGNLGDSGYPYILNIYVGCAALILALVGGLAHGKSQVLPRNLRRFLIGTFLVSLLLSSGRYLPFFHAMYALPFVTLFRYPIKFLMAGLFPLSLLAGYAVHRALSVPAALPAKGRHQFDMLTVSFAGATFGLGIFSGFFSTSPTFVRRFFEIFFQRAPGEIAYQSLKSSLLHALAVCFVITVLLVYRRVKQYSWQRWLFVGVIAVDLLSAGQRINFYAPETFFTNIPPVVNRIRQFIGDGRLFRTQDPLPSMIYVEPQDVFPAPPNHTMWLYRWKLEVLDKYLASYYKIPVIFHQDYDLLAQKYLVVLTKAIEQLPWKQRVPLLSAGNVTTILSGDTVAAPGVQRVAAIPNRGRVPLMLYKNQRAMGDTALVATWKMAASDGEALTWMQAEGYDPRKQVVVQTPEPSLFSFLQPAISSSPIPGAGPDSCQKSSEDTLTQIESTTLSDRYRVVHACDEFLVFSDPFYPGWSVSVDGTPVPVVRANLAFSAIFLPKGTHEIVKSYRPYSYLVGIISSLFAGLGGLFLIMWNKEKYGKTFSS